MKTTAKNQIAGNQCAAHRRAFTLIELLTVIAVIGILAALLFPAFSAVKKHALINHASTEMAQLETAIDRYKAAYGFYPPGNANNPMNPAINQLYYELTGTTNLPNGNYETLNVSSTVSPADVTSFFNVSGFMNCSKTGAGEDAPKARDFLPDLKPNQIGVITNGVGDPANLIVSSIDWPTAAGAQINVQSHNNPWRYNSSNPTNNPGAYDLWLQILIKPGQTNLICNWSKQIQINNPLP